VPLPLGRRLPALLCVVAAACACNDIDGSTGPCVHYFREPILQVTAVRLANSAAEIPVVLLSGFRIDGRPLPATSLLQCEQAVGLAARDSLLECRVPCGFGVASGTWEFTAVAAGSAPTQVTVPGVHYERSGGGCPSWSDGGQRLELELLPAR